MSHACLDCGACCATFRVSFYWAETTAHPHGTVPVEMTVPINPHLTCMKNTEKTPVRCIALNGEIGSQVSCSIYPLRSSTCRDFDSGTDACNKARAQHSLPQLPA